MLIGGFHQFSLSDFPGQAAAIIFTQGCNFRCPYCHNRSLWPRYRTTSTELTTDTILAFLEHRKGLLTGVVVSGGEPTLHPDLPLFLHDVKKLGYAVKLDTNGSRPEIVSDLVKHRLVDYIAMDVKAPFEKYSVLCGLPVETETIRHSIEIAAASGIAHHFRTTSFHPLLSQPDLRKIEAMLPPDSRYIIQAYKPDETECSD